MANDGNRIYGSPSVTDVTSVLGEQATDIISLCTSDRINKWSWYKPVELPFGAWRLQRMTDDDLNGCDDGFGIPSYTSLSAAWADAVAKKDALWVYTGPRGGKESPCVLGDFLGYVHDSRNWFVATTDRDTALADLDAVISWNDGGEGLLRSLGFRSLGERDLVVVLGDSTGPLYVVKILSMSDPGAKAEIMNIPAEGITNGTYMAVPMLADINYGVLPGSVVSDWSVYHTWFPLPVPDYPAIRIDNNSYYYDYFDGITLDVSGNVTTSGDLTSIDAVLSLDRAQETVVTDSLTFDIDIYVPPVFEGNTVNPKKLIAQWSGTIDNGQTLTREISASGLEFVALKDEDSLTLTAEITLIRPPYPRQQQRSVQLIVSSGQ